MDPAKPHSSGTSPWIQVLGGSLLALGAVFLAAGSPGEGLVERDPERALPTFRDGEALQFARDLAERKPRVVVLGNSVIGTSFLEEDLAEELEAPVLRMTLPGSFTALWYVLLKNRVARADPRPELVVLGFRDTYLTEPTHHTTGNYKRRLDYYVDEREPLLDRLAYFPDASAPTLWFTEHVALYKHRQSLRESTEDTIKYGLTGKLLGLGRGRLTKAVNRTFADANKDAALLSAAQLAAVVTIADEHFQFASQVERSFLPAIIDLVRENDMKLVLVHMKTRREAVAQEDPETLPDWARDQLPAYTRDLNAYLQEQGVPVLDFSTDPRITLDLYGNGDHMSEEEGRATFTPLLAEALRPHLPR